METVWNLFALVGAAIWMTVLLAPWRPWSTREFLNAAPLASEADLSDITVLIPARNEADMLKITLPALEAQGRKLSVILIDDQSTDGTALTAREVAGEKLLVVPGQPLPSGWSGKLWALEQGRRHVKTFYTLLLDADIELQHGMLVELREKMKEAGVHLVSLMAALRMQNFWERLLLPAFVYFFKLLYPFHLANSGSSRVAAAAGGCILLETRLLDEIGGFNDLRGELIDDCALARKAKALDYRIWIGLSRSARCRRVYDRLGTIWNMVTRTAFTQLGYSFRALALCTVLMAMSFWVPAVAILLPTTVAKTLAVVGLSCMMVSYLPTLRFYGIPAWWAVTMPLIGTLFLAMTWTSAIRHWMGKGSDWKGRVYGKGGDSERPISRR